MPSFRQITVAALVAAVIIAPGACVVAGLIWAWLRYG
jgi:hypothetical protein